MRGSVHKVDSRLAVQGDQTRPSSSIADGTASEVDHTREQYVLFGPLEEHTYLCYSAVPPNDPYYAVERIVETYAKREDELNQQIRSERVEMWTRYESLLQHFESNTQGDALELTFDYVVSSCPLAEQQLKEPRP